MLRYFLVPLFFLTSACDLVSGGKIGGTLFTARTCPQGNAADFVEEVQEYGDYLRSECDGVAEALNDPSLTAVTREFGPSVIPLRTLPLKSDVTISPHKPWSSWWYPKREDFLFSGGDSSPLGKYDYIRRKSYAANSKPAPNSAMEWEQKSHNRIFSAWEGLCDAWSIAAILMPEPKRGVKFGFTLSSVSFDVADLKALLLKTFDAFDENNLKYYGQKFTGSDSSWIHPDIFPEQFHRFVEKQLYEKKEPFIIDHDPGVEVWNVPVFKANYQVTSLPGQANSVVVRMWIFSAEPTLPADKNFVGTRETIREYNYVLNGTKNENGDLVVSSGYWIKGTDGVDSRKDHPDYLIRILDPQRPTRKSWNPEIENEIVDKILEKAY
jgi:hypothetical protein